MFSLTFVLPADSKKDVSNIANSTFGINCEIFFSVVLLKIHCPFLQSALGRKTKHSSLYLWMSLQVQVTLALILLTAGVGMPIGNIHLTFMI